MTHLIRLGGFVLLLGSIAGQSLAQHDHAHTGPPPERLGSVRFETSCSPAAQPVFDRAMALLHSFWYAAARQAFEEVARLDPACAIAHWGVAMSVWGNPFGGTRTDQMIQEGLAAVERGRRAGSSTPRERDYLDAVEELYREAGSRSVRERQLAYEQAMEQLARRHAEDEEARIFYALALVAAADPADKTYARQLKAGEILEPFFARLADHPGVAHYIIHAYDHPPLAAKALEAAKSYATIAPDAPHALHMPSHTFTRVGYWKDSIETNAASAEAARKADSPWEVLHAMDYQVYAYLQLGQDREAARLLPEARAAGRNLEQQSGYGFAGMFALAAIPARSALERGAWAEAATLEVDESLFPQTEAITRFARALGGIRSGNPAAARAEVARLQELEHALHQRADRYWADQVGIQRDVAEAWLLHAEGRTAEAIERLRAAADREDATEKHAVTPGPLAPARELLGEMLLEANQPAAAREAFEATMKKEPNRFRTLYGAARAAELAGDAAGARQHFSALVTLAGESERQEVRTARAFLESAALESPLAPAPTATKGAWLGPDGELLAFGTGDEVTEFLRGAKVLSTTDISTGVTNPKKLLLERDGVRVHAIFRTEHTVKDQMRLRDGTFHMFFKDSYQGEPAAFELARLLGLQTVPPATSRTLPRLGDGSIQLWIENAMMEMDRRKRKMQPPDVIHFTRQMNNMIVFDNLVNNIDRNLGNILIGPDWKIWYIDCTRCFARSPDLPKPDRVRSLERRFWERLQNLDWDEVRERLSPNVTTFELRALRERHEKLIDLITRRIAEVGEDAVLFSFDDVRRLETPEIPDFPAVSPDPVD